MFGIERLAATWQSCLGSIYSVHSMQIVSKTHIN